MTPSRNSPWIHQARRRSARSPTASPAASSWCTQANSSSSLMEAPVGSRAAAAPSAASLLAIRAGGWERGDCSMASPTSSPAPFRTTRVPSPGTGTLFTRRVQSTSVRPAARRTDGRPGGIVKPTCDRWRNARAIADDSLSAPLSRPTPLLAINRSDPSSANSTRRASTPSLPTSTCRVRCSPLSLRTRVNGVATSARRSDGLTRSAAMVVIGRMMRPVRSASNVRLGAIAASGVLQAARIPMRSAKVQRTLYIASTSEVWQSRFPRVW